MSNIIHTVDGDTLSKIADYVSDEVEEVLNLGQTSKTMHSHVCSLPWSCAECNAPLFADGKPTQCAFDHDDHEGCLFCNKIVTPPVACARSQSYHSVLTVLCQYASGATTSPKFASVASERATVAMSRFVPNAL